MNFSSILQGVVLALIYILQASVDASNIVCTKSCPILHPQQQFCNSDAVVKAKIVSYVFINDEEDIVYGADSTYVRYEVDIQSSLKGFHAAATRAFIYSPSGFTCSIPTMDKEEIYLIAGKISSRGWFTVTDCDGLAIKWAELNQVQRSGVKGKYQAQCDSCRINGAGTTLYIGGELADDGLASGYWSMEGCFFNPIPSIKYGGEDCETLYSYCTPPAGGSTTTTTCSWKETPEYRDCYQMREDSWFFTEKAEPAYTCRSQCNSIEDKQKKYKCVKATKKLEKQGYPKC